MSTLEALWPNMILLHTAGFTRGSARFPNESPVRRVPLSPYLIDRLPVTNAQFARFIAEGGYLSRPGRFFGRFLNKSGDLARQDLRASRGV